MPVYQVEFHNPAGATFSYAHIVEAEDLFEVAQALAELHAKQPNRICLAEFVRCTVIAPSVLRPPTKH